MSLWTFLLSASSSRLVHQISSEIKINKLQPLARMAFSTGPESAVKTNQLVNENILKLGRLNHVAIATPNLEQATAMYRYEDFTSAFLTLPFSN